MSDISGIGKEKLKELMEKNLELLTDRLDPKFGLLDKLLNLKCLSHGECRDIREMETTGAKVEKLLEKVIKKNKIMEFIVGLRDSNQMHLANYWIADGVYDRRRFGDVWPLTESETCLLDANQENLTDNIDSDGALLSKLMAEKVINHRQFEFLSGRSDGYKRNEALLDIVRRASKASYQKWLKCLTETNQKHVAETLLNGSAVIPIHCDLSEETVTDGVPVKVDEAEEDLIVSQMFELLSNKSNEESVRILEKLQLKFVSAKAKQSVCLYFLCETQQDLLSLKSLLMTGRLQSVIETIFSQFLSTVDKPRIIRVIPSLADDTYEKCKNYFQVYTHRHRKRIKMTSSTTDVGLSQRKRDLLRINRDILLNILDAANLLDGLFMKGVIDADEMALISALQSDAKKNEALISVLERGSLEDYRNLIKCLRENNKEDVADILNRGGVVARVEASLLLTGSIELLREMTKTVVDRMNDLLRNKKSSGYSLLHELTRLKLIHASLTSSGDSTILYFHLLTIEDLIHLYDLKQCHQLKSFVESVFNSLLPPTSEVKQKLAPLKWSTEEYERLQQYLFESESLPSEVERFVSRTEGDIISTTQVNSLPFELLDMMLRKAYLIPICSRCGRFPGASENDSFTILASVSRFWFERVRRRRFAAAITRNIRAHIEYISKELVLLRNNWKYLVENMKPKGLAKRMRSFGLSHDYNGLTDSQLRSTNAQKHTSAMNDELLSRIRSLALSSANSCQHSSDQSSSSQSNSVYKDFAESLRHRDQGDIVDLLERGGVMVKCHMVYKKMENFNRALYHRKVIEALSDFISKTTETPKSAWKQLRELDEYGIDFLSATEDNGLNFWLRCRHDDAMSHLQTIYSSGKLLTLLKDLIHSLSSSHERWPVFLEAKLTIDRDNFAKKPVVVHPSVTLRSELDTGDRWVSGVTKYDHQIYVMCHSPSVLLVYADQSPFQLLREVQTKSIRKPLDIAASPASNCLYVTDRGDFSVETGTHENSAVWKVTPVKDEVSKWLDGVDNPFTVSVTIDGRVLLLRWVEPPRLEIYGTDARLIRSIRPPPTFEYPRHAVETPRGTWIVCYWVRHDRTWGVCEIGEADREAETAEIVRRFDPVEGSEPLNHTYHLALDVYGRVSVADNSNNRVVLFDPDFRWSEILLTEARDGVVCPSRVHFDPDKKQLILVHGGRSYRATPGAWGGRKLDVYEVV